MFLIDNFIGNQFTLLALQEGVEEWVCKSCVGKCVNDKLLHIEITDDFQIQEITPIEVQACCSLL